MTPLLSAGVELMMVGMGTVFLFLTLLVFATVAMSRVVGRFFPSVDGSTRNPSAREEEVAAITAAIVLHRKK
ncbi:MAG: OadG family protein [Gammaproteobacteria bacterium]|nr:OadG family protein [Gammaproteobacteria bacterium]